MPAPPVNPPSHGIDSINPMSHIGEAQYTELWQKLFATILSGFWSRLFFFVFIILTLWFGIQRRNPRMAALCALVAALIAYGAGLLGAFKVMHLY